MTRRSRLLIGLSATALAVIMVTVGVAQTFQPSRVECIAPANPGGGWDFTCRTAGRLLTELGLVPGTIRTTNMPGTSGAIAYAHVVSRRGGDNNLIVAASPATTSAIAQGLYGEFDETRVRWLAAIGADFGVIAVKQDARWQNLAEFAADWKRDPRTLTFAGGSAVGGQDHLKLLVLAQAVGIDPQQVRYVPYEGGGEAVTALLGGFVDAVPGDVSEIANHFRAGTVRVLTVLAPERVTEVLPEVPTAKEQGFNAEWVVWRGFYMPAGTSDAAYSFWVDALHQLADSPAWTEARRQSGVAAFWLGGPAFEDFVRRDIANLRLLIRELGL